MASSSCVTSSNPAYVAIIALTAPEAFRSVVCSFFNAAADSSSISLAASPAPRSRLYSSHDASVTSREEKKGFTTCSQNAPCCRYCALMPSNFFSSLETNKSFSISLVSEPKIPCLEDRGVYCIGRPLHVLVKLLREEVPASPSSFFTKFTACRFDFASSPPLSSPLSASSSSSFAETAVALPPEADDTTSRILTLVIAPPIFATPDFDIRASLFDLFSFSVYSTIPRASLILFM